eukprot:SAG25_NODE_6616_length_545_cov_0.865471_1_plen_46_part_10
MLFVSNAARFGFSLVFASASCPTALYHAVGSYHYQNFIVLLVLPAT